MITVKEAIDLARHTNPDLLLVGCERLDNGFLLFVKKKNQTAPDLGAAGLFVSSRGGECSPVPMSFYAQHSTEEEINISRFQRPEETAASNQQLASIFDGMRG
jgi:hypothetical protein